MYFELFELTGFAVGLDVECERKKLMMTSNFLLEQLKRLELLFTEMGKTAGGSRWEDIKSSVLSTLNLKCLLMKSCI